jgi:alpha-acetolactate decarboxylase
MNRQKVKEKCEETFYRRHPEGLYKPVDRNTYVKFANVVRLKAASSVVIPEIESQTDFATVITATTANATTDTANATTTTGTTNATTTATTTSTATSTSRTFLGWRLW